MRVPIRKKVLLLVLILTMIVAAAALATAHAGTPPAQPPCPPTPTPTPAGAEQVSAAMTSPGAAEQNAASLVEQGRKIFRFDTFGDEDFWGGVLGLHQAIQGANLGGVGPGVSPKTALSVGLKVDMDALPATLAQQIQAGQVNLDDPATTLALLKLNAVVGVTGFFDPSGAKLETIGIQCAICHSTVDNAFSYGIGHRLDGLANHDLNVGAIISLAPNLQPIADTLGVDVATVKQVLAAWGPGKYDAELNLDGKGFTPDGKTAATILPNALGLGGHSQHTWTGAWGGITYWNAYVANLQMQGKGNFFDPRLDDAAKYPVAARNGLGHIQRSPDEDMITSKLPALQFYQLALPAPKPVPGTHFDPAAAARGDVLFSGKAQCGTCHVEPIWTEPGWSMHTGAEVGIDEFQASRGPDNRLKTANLTALFVRELGLFMDPANKGRFYHDGRFATLMDVVQHYNSFRGLGLTPAEMHDLVEYLKSL